VGLIFFTFDLDLFDLLFFGSALSFSVFTFTDVTASTAAGYVIFVTFV
jgi:hypothetical protein